LAKRPECDTFEKLLTQALLPGESPEFETQIDTLAKPIDVGEWQWPTRIRIDTKSAESRTIIEVESEDRLGLLHRISKVLTRHGLSIHVARISTEKGAAIDTFYVRTAHGKKPTDEALLQKIKSELETELSEQPTVSGEQKRDTDFTD
jgi:[protein-PII] uridylyltransferase